MKKQMSPALEAVFSTITEGMWAYPYLSRQDKLFNDEYPLTIVWDDLRQIMQMIVCIPARLDDATKQRLMDVIAIEAQTESIEANGATVTVEVVYWHHDEYYTIQTFSVSAILAEAV